MTHHKQNTAIGQMLEAIIENGLEGLAAAVSTLLNEAMKVERSRALGAEPRQRSQGRLGYPNYCETPLPTSPKYTYAPRWPKTSAGILTAPSRSEAERLLDLTVTKYSASCSRLAQWMQSALPEGLRVLLLPQHQRRRLRTTNMLERVNQEIKRRTRVATLFPNEASLLRLVTAVLMVLPRRATETSG